MPPTISPGSPSRPSPHGWRCLAVLALSLPCVRPAAAVETQVRTFHAAADWSPGELDHVSLAPDGSLRLAPDYRKLCDIDEPLVWSVATAGDQLVVGTGHEGRVLRIPTAGGKPTLLYDSPELEIHAVAAAADGTVYAASSPDGKVYRIPAAGGEAQVLFDPEERYIWALATAPDGSLYVATGEKAAVYRVFADGKSAPVLTSDETHILSLALAPDGVLYAGSAGNGYVYRCDPGGETRILLDAEGAEVKALAVAGDGSVYAASTGVTAGDSGASAQPAASTSASLTITADEGGTAAARNPAQAPVAATATPAPAAPGYIPGAYALSGPHQAWLYRIRPDGLPEEIWRTTSETVHALGLIGGRVVLGTGDDGRLFSIDPATGQSSVLVDLPGAQVTGLARHGDGLAAVTANLPGAWTVSAGPGPGGTWSSPAIDALSFATWGRVRIEAEGQVKIAVRSGNTRRPGDRWSPWVETTGDIPSPKARFLQVRLTLVRPAADASATEPRVHEAEVTWLPFNLAPRVRSIALLDPQVDLVSGSSGLGATPPSSLPPVRGKTGPAAADLRGQPREQETWGRRAARFVAEDPNGDQLSYSVYYRGEDEREWKELARDREEPFVSIDATALPDGRYRLKVVASDAPSNPAAQALVGELESEPFVSDLTPPRVGPVVLSRDGGGLKVVATLTDALSPLAWAEWSLDGGPWKPALADDRVFDEGSETVTLTIPAVKAGEHTVVVRAEDAARNVGSGKAVIRD